MGHCSGSMLQKGHSSNSFLLPQCPVLPFLCPVICCRPLSLFLSLSLSLSPFLPMYSLSSLSLLTSCCLLSNAHSSREEYFHLSSRLVIKRKAGFSFRKHFGTERAMIGPSVVFLPAPFQSARLHL